MGTTSTTTRQANMPKIRKKTSNRGDTHTREKVKKKIADAKRKAKKVAKKDVTWKSNKEKDLGIPSKFPFEDQILAEAAAAKERREVEKQQRREQQKAAHQAASLGLPDPAMAALAASSNPYATLEDGEGEYSDTDASSDEEATGISSSLRLHAKSLREVISKSDVIVQVLDARDPEGTRSRKIEREAVQVHGKKLVLVLNKIDLIPKENVEAWLKYLRLSFPTLPFKSSTQSQRKNLSSSNHSSHVPTGASSTSPAPLLTLLENYSRTGSLTVGVIGFPNVGKSSLINTLKRSRACGVAPTPGFTKEVQVISLECKKEHLMMLYNIPAFAGTKDFMIAVARVRGRLRKGGIPDLVGTARGILRDWNAGRIPYYSVPPEVPQGAVASSSSANGAAKSMLTTSEDVGSAAIVNALAPEFDLDSLFQEADAGALEGVKSSKEMAPGSVVRLNESIMSMNLDSATEDGGEFKLMGEDRMVAAADDGDEVPMLEPTPGTAKANKKKRKSEVSDFDEDEGDESVISLAPSTKQQKKKSVSFEASSQKAKMFADTPEEEPVQLNKAIKQQAKKDKKRKDKAAKSAMQDVQAATAPADDDDDDIVDDDAPRPYDFAKFFGAPGTATAVQDEDEDM